MANSLDLDFNPGYLCLGIDLATSYVPSGLFYMAQLPSSLLVEVLQLYP